MRAFWFGVMLFLGLNGCAHRPGGDRDLAADERLGLAEEADGEEVIGELQETERREEQRNLERQITDPQEIR